MPKPTVEEIAPAAELNDQDSFDQEVEAMVPKKARAEMSHGAIVKVRITKFGAGKVSTGVHIAEKGDKMAERDEVIEVAHSVAVTLEERGLAEIV